MKNIKAVSIGDLHCPYQSNRAISLVLKFLNWYKPNYIFLHELIDGYSISSFDKSPDRIDTLQKELDISIDFLKKLRQSCPKSKIFLLDSNHQDRLQKYLIRKAPGLHSLRNLGIDRLLNLKEFDIKSIPEYQLNDVLFIHGTTAGTNPSNTAFKKNMMNMVQGHAHRAETKYFKTRAAQMFSMSIGCLCDIGLVADQYIKGFCNWNQGFGIVEWKNKKVYPTNIVFEDFSFMFGNKLFEG